MTITDHAHDHDLHADEAHGAGSHSDGGAAGAPLRTHRRAARAAVVLTAVALALLTACEPSPPPRNLPAPVVEIPGATYWNFVDSSWPGSDRIEWAYLYERPGTAESLCLDAKRALEAKGWVIGKMANLPICQRPAADPSSGVNFFGFNQAGDLVSGVGNASGGMANIQLTVVK